MIQLTQQLSIAHQKLVVEWPEIEPFLDDIVVTMKNTSEKEAWGDQVAATNQQRTASEQSQLSTEDRLELRQQLKALSVLPPVAPHEADLSEIVTRLTLVCRRSVLLKHMDKILPFVHGKVQRVAAPNGAKGLYLSPRALLTDPTAIIQPWCNNAPVLVINPNLGIAITTQVAGIFSASSARYQFALSSPLIQAGKFWSPGSEGRVVVFFLGEGLPNGSVLSM